MGLEYTQVWYECRMDWYDEMQALAEQEQEQETEEAEE